MILTVHEEENGLILSQAFSCFLNMRLHIGDPQCGEWKMSSVTVNAVMWFIKLVPEASGHMYILLWSSTRKGFQVKLSCVCI